MITDGELYKKLGDWFHNNTSPLIPQAGMDYPQALIDEFKLFFSPIVTIRLKGFSLEGMPDKSLSFHPPCHLVNLPLIVGLHSGLSQDKLIQIASHHPIDVFPLIDTLDNIMGTTYSMEDIFEQEIPLSKIYSDCITVIAKVYPDEFTTRLSFFKERSDVNAASLLSNNPVHWPVTRLKSMMKAYEKGNLPPGQYFNDEFFNINATFLTDDYLPKDASGPRFDAVLERSGMLMDEVARKKLGAVGLWEQMLAVAKFDKENNVSDNQGMSGLLNYCIHSAQVHMRPAIFRGLSSMTLVNAEAVNDGVGMYNFLMEKVTDTWLEPLLDNPLLLINLVAEDRAIQYGGYSVLDNPETLLDRCLKEIMATPPNQLGASHFRIFLLDKMSPPEQVLPADIKPERIIRHMLLGLESFAVPESVEDLRDKETNEFPFKGCNYVIKTLARHHEFDYQVFKGLGSRSIRVLVEAGLDKRKLPRMNNRDKGHLISEELGL